MDNVITDPAIRALLMKQAARRQAVEQLVQTYVDMVSLFCDAVGVVRAGQEAGTRYADLAAQAAQTDLAVVRLLRLHMMDKLLDLPPACHKQAGRDIGEAEFIRAVRLIAVYKKAYLDAHPKTRQYLPETGAR